MMRSPTYYATAVRTPQGTIVIQKTRYEALTHRFRFLNIPIVRGAIDLVEMMWIGIQSLSYSAVAGRRRECRPQAEEDDRVEPRDLRLGRVCAGRRLRTVLLPAAVPDRAHRSAGQHRLQPVDGAFRLTIFLAYLLVIARWKEMRRVFQYHGAEHKTIYVYENGQDLTVANARPYTTLHPRCGTSFLLVVMLVSILVFSLLGKPETMRRPAASLRLHSGDRRHLVRVHPPLRERDASRATSSPRSGPASCCKRSRPRNPPMICSKSRSPPWKRVSTTRT